MELLIGGGKFYSEEYAAFLAKSELYPDKVKPESGQFTLSVINATRPFGPTYLFYKMNKPNGLNNYWGTSWMSYFTDDSNLDLAIGHCCMNERDYKFIRENELYCMFMINSDGQQQYFTGINRNGITSADYSTRNFWRVFSMDFIYFSITENRMVRVSPFLGNSYKHWDGKFGYVFEYDGTYESFKTLLTTAHGVVTSSAGSMYLESVKQSGWYSFLKVLEASSMWGTPYRNFATYDSSWNRIVQHALPDKVTFDYQVANNLTVIALIDYAEGKPSYISYTRNGFTSTAYGSYPRSIGVKKIVFKSLTENKMMSYDPASDSPPVVWDGVL